MFGVLYPLNWTSQDAQGTQAIGTAFGRYPEDQYVGGNPWFLCTAAIAELYYRAARSWVASGSLTITDLNQAFFSSLDASKFSSLQPGQTLSSGSRTFADIISTLQSAGDAQLRVIKLHTDNFGSLSEQFDRCKGFETSFGDLSWSYASLLTAGLRANGYISPGEHHPAPCSGPRRIARRPPRRESLWSRLRQAFEPCWHSRGRDSRGGTWAYSLLGRGRQAIRQAFEPCWRSRGRDSAVEHGLIRSSEGDVRQAARATNAPRMTTPDHSIPSDYGQRSNPQDKSGRPSRPQRPVDGPRPAPTTLDDLAQPLIELEQAIKQLLREIKPGQSDKPGRNAPDGTSLLPAGAAASPRSSPSSWRQCPPVSGRRSLRKTTFTPDCRRRAYLFSHRRPY